MALVGALGYALLVLLLLFVGLIFVSRVLVATLSGGNPYALLIAVGMIAVFAARWTWVRLRK